MSPKNVLHLGVFAGLVGLCGSAEAQISRVFVSVNGNDANACANQATPCRTIGGGITQVDPNGEVIIVDTGSYAGGTITKAVKVNAAPGIVAFSGLTITVNPGAGNTVVLRGLTIKAAVPGVPGVVHSSGNLIVEECVVDGWANGISSNAGASGHLSVNNSTFRNNVNVGAVALISGTAVVTNVHASNNLQAITSLNPGTTLTLSNSVIIRNNIGLLSGAGGTLISMGNNVVEGNAQNNTQGTITPGTLK